MSGGDQQDLIIQSMTENLIDYEEQSSLSRNFQAPSEYSLWTEGSVQLVGRFYQYNNQVVCFTALIM